MTTLNSLCNTHREEKTPKRRGRGQGSKLGKTCGRGEKGGGSRSGYKRRFGNEGGNFPLYRKLPCRGFSNARFKVTYDVVNLNQLNAVFADGDTVNLETLTKKGFVSGRTDGVKILGNGQLHKKLVMIEVDAISSSAREKLTKAKIPFKLVAN
jgi:large subunit ribosomal protein L15